MIKTLLSKGWKFADFPMVDGYVDVDLPHDYSIKKPRDPKNDMYQGYYPVTCGKYVKFLKFENNTRYILDIDGAYACTEVSLNDDLLSLHPHGYTPLLVDLTDSIIDGIENKLVITTNPLEFSTRWYSGCGIYRDVFLWQGGPCRIEPWDMFISTSSVDNDGAKVKLDYTITADFDAKLFVKFTVTDKNAKTVAVFGDNLSAKKGKNNFENYFTVKNPNLWDVDNPCLYNLKTEIFNGDVLLDTAFNDFGIRTLYAYAKVGLLVNGKSVKLRGGCIHHDHGALGACAFPTAEARKIQLLKDAGFNAVRISHNPPSLALLEACDRIGMFVMDEAFDIWNKRKFVVSDYHIFFKEWWDRDISYMVLRDRNHPSVISYSIGNEIYEIDGTSQAGEWSRKLSDEIRKYDDTKFVTAAIQKLSLADFRPEEIDPEDYRAVMTERNGGKDQRKINKITEPFEKPLDIVGFNYHHKHYDVFHEDNPDRVIWGSENWTLDFYDYWKDVTDNDYNIGDFTWTAIDNLGEVGHGLFFWERDKDTVNRWDYPWRTCYQGDLDLCGYRLPRSYFRETVWFGGDTPRIFVTHPEHFGEELLGRGWHWYDVHESWTFDDKYVGKPITVETYIIADKVEWLINGKKVGECVPEKAIARFNTVYEKGEITAVAYRNGKEFSRYTLHTNGSPYAVKVVPEKADFNADNRDLCYFDLSIVDKNGRLVALSDNQISAQVSGGELLCVFSGDPCNEDDYTSNTCHVFKGRALAVVRAKDKGKVKISVSANGLITGEAQVTAK
ncbi:MAG: glycoside hydrolase family 2 protein [Clostridiales bacterium]|nr:glycoside hydrolase family 2 protein [Clostridiales bacterium]